MFKMCKKNQVWVCSACGKTSRTRAGWNKKQEMTCDPGWDVSCMTHAVLCHIEKDKDGNWVAFKAAQAPPP